MTRQLEIVNLSNWDGEDYEVSFWDEDREAETQTIKPGESAVIPCYSKVGKIRVTPTESQKPKPFKKSGKQITPQMTLDFG